MEPTRGDQPVTIKQEIEALLEDVNALIKTENNTFSLLEKPPDIETTEKQQKEEPENCFSNVNIFVKEEASSSENDHNFLEQAPVDLGVDEIRIELDSIETVESGTVKEEVTDSVINDYGNEDNGSVDSMEAMALGIVETCLQEDINVKSENELGAQMDSEELSNAKVKGEFEAPELVTPDLNCDQSSRYPFLTITRTQSFNNVDQIVSIPNGTQYNMHENDLKLELNSADNGLFDTNDEYNSFQLNSITGDVLPLDQEAYGVNKTKTYNCELCPKVSHSKSGHNRHLQAHTTIRNYEEGRKRGKETRKRNQLLQKKLDRLNARKRNKTQSQNGETETGDSKNLSRIQETYKCICKKVFKRKSLMEGCLRRHEWGTTFNRNYVCVTCTNAFKTKQELDLHRKRLHRKKFPCKFCPTDYDTRKLLFRHLQTHHELNLTEYKVIQEVVNGKNKMKCFSCLKTFTELSILKIHVMTDHQSPYICPHCKNTFTKLEEITSHIKSYHPNIDGQFAMDVLEAFVRLVKDWKCVECQLQFYEPDKLALHQTEHHTCSQPQVESSVQCPDCRRVFASQKSLTSHKRIHESVESTEDPKLEDLGLMCLECRTICKDINALTHHMRFHSPDRKYACKYCDFRFSSIDKRRIHCKIHTGDLKFVCFICEYQCSTFNRLKKHKWSQKHHNMKEYLLTGKPLVEESTSTDKEKKHSSSKKRKKEVGDKNGAKKSDSSSGSETEVSCEVCGENFPSESKMLEHKQTHPFIEFPNEDTPTRIFFK